MLVGRPSEGFGYGAGPSPSPHRAGVAVRGHQQRPVPHMRPSHEDSTHTCWSADPFRAPSAVEWKWTASSSSRSKAPISPSATAEATPVRCRMGGTYRSAGATMSMGRHRPRKTESFTALSSGDAFTCALRQDGSALVLGRGPRGSIFSSARRGLQRASAAEARSPAPSVENGSPVACWGADDRGSVVPASRASPSRRSAAGRRSPAAFGTNGSVVCWGSGRREPGIPAGECGRFVIHQQWRLARLRPARGRQPVLLGKQRERPERLPPLLIEFASITSGRNRIAAVNATMATWCVWGHSPEFPLGERLTHLTIGDHHTCALRYDGSPVCWGYGYDTPTESAKRPPLEAIGKERFTAISSGYEHACALREDGEPICWAWYGSDGEPLVPYGERLASISSGGHHVCGLRRDGTAVCWGADWYGQSTPPQSERFLQLSSGYTYTCALREDGSPVCWGEDEHGETSPPDGERFTAISAGIGLQVRHTCALREDGRAVCWGGIDADRNFGQASPPEGDRFGTISVGGSHTCALRVEDGTAVCWGRDDVNQSSPPEGVAFSAITSGRAHTCALRLEDGTAVCWGSDRDHVNDYRGQASPPYGVRFAAISAGEDFTCAVRFEDSAPVCWGKGFQYDQPEEVPFSSVKEESFTSVSSGGNHVCALREDRTAACWGQQLRQQGVATAGAVQRDQQRYGDHTCALRAGRRRSGLLGQQQGSFRQISPVQGSGLSAIPRAVHCNQQRRRTHLRPEGGRHGSVLGRRRSRSIVTP